MQNTPSATEGVYGYGNCESRLAWSDLNSTNEPFINWGWGVCYAMCFWEPKQMGGHCKFYEKFDEKLMVNMVYRSQIGSV